MKKPQAASFALFFLSLLLLVAPRADATLGVVLGPTAASVAAPLLVRALTVSGIQVVRIPVVHPKIMDAIKGTRFKLVVGVANGDVVRFALGGTAAALEWLNSKVIPHVERGQVIAVTVGEDVLSFAPKETHFVVAAMRNLRMALKQVDLGRRIKISSPVSSSVLVTPFPPSAGKFSPVSRPLMDRMLRTLNETGSPLMLNVNPVEMMPKGAEGLLMGFFLGQNAMTADGGRMYTNGLDAAVDAAATAVATLGYANIPVVVSSTGWPARGGSPVANERNSATYLEGVIRRAQWGSGTPMTPKMSMDVFVQNLFNAQGKWEHNEGVGIFNLDGTLAINATIFSGDSRGPAHSIAVPPTTAREEEMPAAPSPATGAAVSSSSDTVNDGASTTTAWPPVRRLWRRRRPRQPHTSAIPATDTENRPPPK